MCADMTKLRAFSLSAKIIFQIHSLHRHFIFMKDVSVAFDTFKGKVWTREQGTPRNCNLKPLPVAKVSLQYPLNYSIYLYYLNYVVLRSIRTLNYVFGLGFVTSKHPQYFTKPYI